MTMNGAASTSVYPQEDEDGEPVRFWSTEPIRWSTLTINSSLQNTVTALTEIIKPSQYRRCQSVHQQDSFLEVWT